MHMQVLDMMVVRHVILTKSYVMATGAGDRLGLQCPETGECMPAAVLPYCGRTMLEGLMRDLQVPDCCVCLRTFFTSSECSRAAGGMI